MQKVSMKPDWVSLGEFLETWKSVLGPQEKLRTPIPFPASKEQPEHKTIHGSRTLGRDWLPQTQPRASLSRSASVDRVPTTPLKTLTVSTVLST